MDCFIALILEQHSTSVLIRLSPFRLTVANHSRFRYLDRKMHMHIISFSTITAHCYDALIQNIVIQVQPTMAHIADLQQRQ
jgi:hypothetical protein